MLTSQSSTLLLSKNPAFSGRAWICLCLNEGQLESYLHVLTTHQLLLGSHYGSQALLRDPHRTHLLLMLAAGLEHIRFTIPVVCIFFSPCLFVYIDILRQDWRGGMFLDF